MSYWLLAASRKYKEMSRRWVVEDSLAGFQSLIQAGTTMGQLKRLG